MYECYVCVYVGDVSLQAILGYDCMYIMQLHVCMYVCTICTYVCTLCTFHVIHLYFCVFLNVCYVMLCLYPLCVYMLCMYVRDVNV